MNLDGRIWTSDRIPTKIWQHSKFCTYKHKLSFQLVKKKIWRWREFVYWLVSLPSYTCWDYPQSTTINRTSSGNSSNNNHTGKGGGVVLTTPSFWWPQVYDRRREGHTVQPVYWIGKTHSQRSKLFDPIIITDVDSIRLLIFPITHSPRIMSRNTNIHKY